MGQETVLGIRINVDASSASPASAEASAALNKVKTDLGALQERFGTLTAAQQKYVAAQYQAMQAAAGNTNAVRALQGAMQGFNSTQIETLLTMGKVTDEAKKGAAGNESMFGSFVKGAIVVDLAKQAMSALIGTYSDMKTATQELQQEQLRVEAVLTATGRSAEGLRERIGALATGMQQLTKFDDGAVMKAGAVLATFTEITGQHFERTIQLAGDLALVFGGDLTSRTEQLARALTDPAESLGQLERQFGKFNPVLKQQVKDLMAMNEVSQAQKLILDELAGRVGGAATAAYTGLELKVSATSKAYDNLLKAMGDAIFDKNSKDVGFLAEGMNTLTNVIELQIPWWQKLNIAMSGVGGAAALVDAANAAAAAPKPVNLRAMENAYDAAAEAEAKAKVQRAAEGINKIIEDTRDKRSKLNDELERINKLTMDRLAMAGSAEESAKILAEMDTATAGLQRKYAERKAAVAKEVKDTYDSSAQWAKAALDYAMGVAKGDLEQIKGYLDETSKAIEAAHKAGLLSEQGYWEKKAQLVEDGVAANEVALQDELDALYAQQSELRDARTMAGNDAKKVDEINLKLAATDAKVLDIDTKLEANQRKLGDATRLRAQGTQAATDAQRKFYEEVQRAVEPERQQLEALQLANAQWGLTPVQIAEANVALAESNLQLALNGRGVVANTEEWEKNVEIMRQRVQIARDGVGAVQVRTALEAETHAIQDMWQATEQVAKSAWDIMVDGAGNTAQRLKDAFKRLFFDWIWNEFAKKQVMNLFISATGVSATQANAAGLFSGTSGSGMTSLIDGIGNWLGGLFGGGGSSGGANLGGTLAGGATSAWGAASGSANGNWLTTFTNTFSSNGTGGNWLSMLGSLFSSSGTAGQWLSQIGSWFGIGGSTYGVGSGAVLTPTALGVDAAVAGTGGGVWSGMGGFSGALGSAGIGAIIGGFLGPMVSQDERAGTAGTIGGAVGGVIGSAAAAWLVGAEVGSIAGPIGTIIGAVIGAVIGALSTGDGIAQRVAKFVTGSGKDYTYQGSSEFGQFGIERGSDQWFSDVEMKETLDGWMQSIALLDNSIAAHLTAAQIGQVQGALGGTGGSTYSFGMEHQDIPGGTYGAIIRERYTAVFSVLDVEMSKLIATFEGTTEDLIKLIGDLATVHFTLEQQGAAIAAVIGEGLDITKLQAMHKEGESYTETMQRLVEVFSVTNEVARSMGKTVEEAFGGVGLSTEKVRQQLIDYAGGIENLQGLLQSYYQNYFSAQERAAMQLDDVKKGFQLLGIEMPLTKQEFRDLVDGLDVTTAEGALLYVELMKLAPGFAAVADSAAALAAQAIATAQAGQTVALSLGTTTAALFGLGEAGTAAMTDLVDQAGGAQNMGQLIGSYQQNYLSPQQQQQINEAAMRQQFADLGVAMPTSKQGFTDLITGLDLTTASGRKLLIELLKLGPGFAQVTDAAKAQADADRALAQVGAIVAATMGTTSAALFGVGAAGKAALEQMAGLVGGSQNLAQLVNGYQQSFLSAQERYVVNLGDLRSKFQELGVTMPTTKQGFADLINGLDLTTEHDRVLYAALLQLAPQFASVADYAEQMRAKTQQLLDGMQQYIDFDPAAAITAAMNPQTLTQQWQTTGTELRRVMALYDGSEAAQQRIAQAMQARYQTELQLVQAIAEALNGIKGLANDTIRSMTLQTLTPEQKYLFYDAEIVRARAQLAAATDPAEIASLTQTMINDVNAAFNLLSPAEQIARLNEFTARIETIRAEAQARLEATGATLSADHVSLPDSIKTAIETSMQKIVESMNTAADGMGDAANAMKAGGTAAKEAAAAQMDAVIRFAKAVDTPAKVNVGISVQDDRIVTEVN